LIQVWARGSTFKASFLQILLESEPIFGSLYFNGRADRLIRRTIVIKSLDSVKKVPP
jgi:hypothetical protein